MDDTLADAATAVAELISMKGLGFIWVLEVTDRPEILSPPFAFRFSKADTEALLSSCLGKKIPASTLEIPHAAAEPAEIRAVLQERYVTAIRLPFRDAEIAAKVRIDVARSSVTSGPRSASQSTPMEGI